MELIIAFVGIIWLLLRLGDERLSAASVRADKRRIAEYESYLKRFVATDDEYKSIVHMVKYKPLSEYMQEIEGDLAAMFGSGYRNEQQGFTKKTHIMNPETHLWSGELFVIDPCIELVAELILSKRGKIRDAISFQKYDYWGTETKRKHMRLLLQRIEHNLKKSGIDVEYVIVAEIRKNVLTDKFETRIGSGCKIQPKKMCLSSSVTQRLW